MTTAIAATMRIENYDVVIAIAITYRNLKSYLGHGLTHMVNMIYGNPFFLLPNFELQQGGHPISPITVRMVQ